MNARIIKRLALASALFAACGLKVGHYPYVGADNRLAPFLLWNPGVAVHRSPETFALCVSRHSLPLGNGVGHPRGKKHADHRLARSHQIRIGLEQARLGVFRLRRRGIVSLRGRDRKSHHARNKCQPQR